MPIAAKTTPPWLEGIHPRQRLFDALDAHHAASMTWIWGAPGAGKTTLAASYIQARDLNCLWLTLDPADADPATLLHYLGVAAARARRRRQPPLPAFSADNLADPAAFSVRFFDALYRSLTPPFVLVFDNYQTLPEDSAGQAILARHLGALPAGGRALILSREPPPPPYARLQMGRRVAMLPPHALRLDADEQRALAALHCGTRLDGRLLDDLLRYADGWAAGLTALLAGVGGEQPSPAIPDGASLQALFNIFVGELCAQLETPQRELLLKTALLPDPSEAMAREITDSPQVGRLLNRLADRHLFVQRYADAPTLFRFHPLFRDYLLARVEDCFSADELLALTGRAAAILERGGRAEDAARLFTRAEDWNGLERLIQRHGRKLLRQGRAGQLLGWLRTLPESRRERSPWLLFWEARCRFFTDPQSAITQFREAYARFREQAVTVGAVLCWCGAVDACLARRSDLHPLDDWIVAYDSLRGPLERLPAALRARVDQSRLAALMYRRPDHPELPRLAEQIRDRLQHAEPDRHALHGLSMTMLYFALAGRLGDCRFMADSLLPPLRTGAATPLDRIVALHVEAVVHWLAGALQDSLTAARTGLQLADQAGIPVFDNALNAHAGHACLAMDDLEGARTHLAAVTGRLNPAQSFDTWYYHHLAGWARLLRGELEHAARHAQLTLDHAMRSGVAFSEITAHMAVCLCAWEQGDGECARTHLARAREISERAAYPLGRFMSAMAEARFRFEDGDEPAGLEALRRGLATSRESGHIQLTWWRRAELSRICARALEADIETAQALRIITRLRLTPHEANRHPENWPMPLKARTLGRFEVLRDGEPIRFSGKAQRRPMDLLKLLIASGGREVPATKLTDALWPDTEGDGAYRCLVTTLSRLRKLLGISEAVRLDGAVVGLNPTYWWIDVWSFEDAYEQAHVLTRLEPPRLAPERLRHLRRKILGLYHGPFLDGEPEERWLLPARELLRARFLRQTQWQAEAWQALGDDEQALECYRSAIEVAPEAEQTYRRLLALCLDTGRISEGLDAYRLCRNNLHACWKAPPSEPTERLYRALIDNLGPSCPERRK